jgi:hypothetical protein
MADIMPPGRWLSKTLVIDACGVSFKDQFFGGLANSGFKISLSGKIAILEVPR